MRVAFDFDGTYTLLRAELGLLMHMLVEGGHEACIVTQRCDKYEEEIRALLPPRLNWIPIYFAAGYTKRDYMNLMGESVDVWIEDNPDSINNLALAYTGCLEED